MPAMKVFISWSGDTAKAVALELRNWLPRVLQQVQAWVSDEDLQKGGRWSFELATELQDTSYGLICLTQENQNSPWLNFEAGSLAKEINEKTRVVPILIDLWPSEVVTPLKEFQATRLTEQDFVKTIKQMNLLTANPLEDRVVEDTFGRWWPDLHNAVRKILSTDRHPSAPARRQRSERQMLEEVLELVRGLSQQQVTVIPDSWLGKGLVDFDASPPPDPAAQARTEILKRLALHGTRADVKETSAPAAPVPELTITARGVLDPVLQAYISGVAKQHNIKINYLRA